MISKKTILNYSFEIILFMLNSTIIIYGLFNVLFTNRSVDNSFFYSVFIVIIGLIGGIIIPGASIFFRRMISKVESTSNVISIEEFRLFIPFLMTALIFAVVVSTLFKGIMLDLRSLSELSAANKTLGPLGGLIITLPFFIIETSPFIIRLLLNSKNQIINEQTKEISVINQQLKQSYETQLKIVSSIQHELGNKLPIVKFSVSDLQNHLTKLSHNGIINLDERIREPFEGEPPSNVASTNSLLDTINRELQNSALIVQNMRAIVQTDSDNIDKTPTIVNELIKDDLKHRLKQLPKGFLVQIHGEEVAANIDKTQFRVLLDNIYSNTLRHGFSEEQENFVMRIQIRKEKNSLQIIFMNNGKPFPESMTSSKYTQLNEFDGKTGNSGIGGYLIGLVVRNHNGKLSIDKRKDLHGHNAFVVIELPIS